MIGRKMAKVLVNLKIARKIGSNKEIVDSTMEGQGDFRTIAEMSRLNRRLRDHRQIVDVP